MFNLTLVDLGENMLPFKSGFFNIPGLTHSFGTYFNFSVGVVTLSSKTKIK